MSTIVVHLINETQENALQVFCETLGIQCKKIWDETEYLMASKANETALNESIKQLHDGKGITLSIEDLWKNY